LHLAPPWNDYGAAMKIGMHLIAVGALLAVFAQPSLAFQESSVGGSSDSATARAADQAAPKNFGDLGKGLNLKMPELSIGKDTGTEVRIPGAGPLGVLPKLDFGLELLYGANDPSGRPDDKSQPSDVQIRATIKHRF
jgi:hypothetical protein